MPGKSHSAEIFAPKNKLVIVNHFEIQCPDPIANRIKLNFLAQLMVDVAAGRSSYHPAYIPLPFLDSAFIEAQKKMRRNTVRRQGDEKSPANAKSMRGGRILNVGTFLLRALSHYTKNRSPYQADSENVRFVGKDDMCRKKTKWGNFLNQLRKPATEGRKEMIAEQKLRLAATSELAFKLEMSSHYFYMCTSGNR